MKPSNFTGHPWSSILQKSEYETIAQNIMIILKRTGDKFRPLSWEEYKRERLKDKKFSEGERRFFDGVIGYCINSESALTFCSGWNQKLN